MSKDLTRCPKCGSMAKTFLHSTTTAVYYYAHYDEEGNLIDGDRNTITNHYKCDMCGERYESKQ